MEMENNGYPISPTLQQLPNWSPLLHQIRESKCTKETHPENSPTQTRNPLSKPVRNMRGPQLRIK